MDTYRHIRDHKRRLGAYYTPINIARVLTNWAIRDPADLILEPSFGGCGFLAASKQRLIELGGVGQHSQNVYGCDIDIHAFEHLAKHIPNANGNFVHRDYLDLTPLNFSNAKFDVILGNPPYVPRHRMSDEQITNGQLALQQEGIILDKRASLWAYFVLHSLSFLKTRGRTAWILPSSFIHADYAADVKNVTRARFARSLAIQIRERLFLDEGAKEATVVFLCDGWNENHLTSDFEIAEVPTIQEAQQLIMDWDAGKWKGYQWESHSKLHLLSESVRGIYEDLLCDQEIRSLGDYCRVRIGIVTGANKFFVLSLDAAQAANIPISQLKPIVAKYRDYSGLCVRKEDLLAARERGRRCLLVSTNNDNDIAESVRNYLQSFPKYRLEQNRTFGKRSIWHQPDDQLIPDAFFPYMTQNGPSLLLNYAGVNSTNTVHRVYFHNGISDIVKKAVAISLLSVFSQLSAEMESRSYGSGVLKHEPSEIGQIKVIVQENLDPDYVNRIFCEIDELLRRREGQAAEKMANQFVFQNYPQAQRTHIITALHNDLELVRKGRQSPKNGKYG